MKMGDVKNQCLGTMDNKSGVAIAPETSLQTIRTITQELETKSRVGTDGPTLKSMGSYPMGLLREFIPGTTTSLPVGQVFASMGIAAGTAIFGGQSSPGAKNTAPSLAHKGVSLSRDSKMTGPKQH